MRRAAKIDANQSEVVDALRKIGCSVTLLAAVGDGVPDLLVGYRSRTIMLEVKDGRKPPSARRLTPDQERWHSAWRGGPVWTVTSAQQAVEIMMRIDA
jgi:hypothetical protein